MDLAFTIEKTTKEIPTYNELFDYLEKELKSYYLLSASEREVCNEAISQLQRVFKRFKKS